MAGRESTITRALTRSGCQAEKDMALWPPIEWPTSATRRQPSASMTAEQVGGEVLGRVGGRLRPLALAVTALIERDHVESVGERRRDAIEPVRVGGAAVQEAEHRAPGVPHSRKLKRRPLTSTERRARGLASEACSG